MYKFLIILFLLTSVQSFGQDRVYTIVDTSPKFPGGLSAFYDYVHEQLVYPEQARIDQVEGKSFVQFIVEKNGQLSEVKAIMGIGSGCDKEAVRLVKNASNFIPGFNGREPVRVRLLLPITFKLNPGESKKEPEEIFYLPATSVEELISNPDIQQLALDFKGITTFDKRINEITQLTYLNLTGNKLTGLPDEIESLTNLKELHLTYNQLKELPTTFAQLQSLRTLYLDRNAIHKFPDELLQLQSLETIDISYTNIIELPLQVADMSNLNTIYARGTVISKDQIERIREINPNIKILK